MACIRLSITLVQGERVCSDEMEQDAEQGQRREEKVEGRKGNGKRKGQKDVGKERKKEKRERKRGIGERRGEERRGQGALKEKDIERQETRGDREREKGDEKG